MTIKLLTEHHLEFLCLKRGFIGSSESTLVIVPHCWKSHAWLIYSSLSDRRPVHRPQLYELDNDSVRLSWEPAFIPTGTTRRPVRYMVDMREIPEKSWRQAASDLLDTNYKIRGLRSKSDYEFRVKALIDGETSEPSLPVALYRRSGMILIDFPLTVKAATLIIISGRCLAISSAKEGKSGFIYNLVKS